MAEDEDLSRRYRELAREEPPRHLDQAILAASRRAAETRPAPLVVPSGRRRWTFPLAAAAIIVLAVAVTVHMDREQPAEEVLSAPADQATPAAPAAPAAASPERRERMGESAASAPRLSASVMQSPEQWLQGIADLRGQGWHEEADRQLAEFRKRYPDYRIPDAMLERVEKR